MNLTVRDVARMLNSSERTVYRWIDRGDLPAYRVNGQYRFNRAELLEWATARRVRISPEVLQEPDNGAVPPTLGEALRLGGIHYRIAGTDKPSVLLAVVNQLRLPPEVDRDWLYAMLLARERLGSTAVGDGIAIPHVRYPIVLHDARLMVSLCFLEAPIDFGALDGKPVGVLFTLVSPSVRAHLQILSRLGFVLHDQALKETLHRVGGREEILEGIERAESALPALAVARAGEPV
jgi:PTS system nitrogen regulatory IIA component